MTRGRYDFNDASKQSNLREPFPPGVYKLKTYLRQGGAGDEGALRTSKNGLSEMLDFEFTVQAPNAYAARKLWENWVFKPTEDNDRPTEGLQTAIDITRSKIKALLESARGVNSGDDSEEANDKRSFDSVLDLDGLVFVARIGIKTNPGYSDKNVINEIITPDDKLWFSHMAQDQVRRAGEEGQANARLVERKKPDFDDEIPF
jgi:hypothetical protein